MKTLIISMIFIFTNFAAYAEPVQIICNNQSQDKQLQIHHGFSNREARYIVKDLNNEFVIGNGLLTFNGDFLFSTAVSNYQNEKSDITITIDLTNSGPLNEILSGKHKAKADAYVDYNFGVFEGSNLNCSVKLSN